MRKYLAALFLALSLVPAFAQPPPVPTLPDTERRTSYSLSASVCTCAVNFALYGDSTDYGNWIEVFLTTGSGSTAVVTKLAAVTDYTLTSATGPLATIPRPITDGVLTLTVARTGTLQIVGSRRPRRLSQFSENRGVAARDLNQALTDIIASNRETWDRTNDTTGRAILAPAGETLTGLPVAAARASNILGFDGSGNPAIYTPNSIAFALQSANKIFAGPTSGSPAAPQFRSLVTADMPSIFAGVSSISFAGASNTTGLLSVVADASQPDVTSVNGYFNDAGFRIGNNATYNPVTDFWTQVKPSIASSVDEYGRGGARILWAMKAGTGPGNGSTPAPPNAALRKILEYGWASGDPYLHLNNPFQVYARTTAPGYNFIQQWYAEDTTTLYASMGSTGSFQLTPAANVSPLTVVGYSLTGTNAQAMFDLAGTLNASGVVDVFKLAVTDTAHGAGTKLFNIYGGASGSTSEFSVDTSGNVLITGTAQATAIGLGVASTSTELVNIVKAQNNSTRIKVANTNGGNTALSGFYATNDSGGGVAMYATSSTYSGLPQNFGFITSDGALAGLFLNAGAGNVKLGTASNARWEVSGASPFSLIATTDNVSDIGASGANRPRTIYAGTSVISPAYTVGATAGVSCTIVGATAHLTVVNGIVTLCN